MEKSDKLKKIGRRLVELRGIRTRKGVADETGISYSSLSNYEHGIRMPGDEHKVLLAKFYEIPVGELFFADEYYENE